MVQNNLWQYEWMADLLQLIFQWVICSLRLTNCWFSASAYLLRHQFPLDTIRTELLRKCFTVISLKSNISDNFSFLFIQWWFCFKIQWIFFTNLKNDEQFFHLMNDRYRGLQWKIKWIKELRSFNPKGVGC